ARARGRHLHRDAGRGGRRVEPVPHVRGRDDGAADGPWRPGQPRPLMADLLITGGVVADGTGAPEYAADVAISGGLVEAVGDLAGRSAARVLSADGCVVCPGFVDVH